MSDERAIEIVRRHRQEPPPDAGMEALERLRVAAQAYSRPYRNESADCDAELIRSALTGRAAPSSDALREALGWLEERTRLDRFGEPEEIRAAVMAVLVASLAGRAAPVEEKGAVVGVASVFWAACIRSLLLYAGHGEDCEDRLVAGAKAARNRERAEFCERALSTPPAAVEGERDPEQSYYLNGPWEGSNVGVAYASRESGPAILVRYGWQQYGAFVCSHRPGHPGAISLTFVRTPEGDYKLSDLMPLPAPPTAPLTQQKQHSILCPAWIYEPCTCYLATQQKGSECER